MKDEKQTIEEMARIICKPTANRGNCEKCGFKKGCSKFDDATDLYNEGYRKQSEWISVDERLPDNDGKYLVAREECGRYSISVRKFRKEVPCWYTGYCGHWERRTNGITHWMPLPEAPKMKGGDTDA